MKRTRAADFGDNSDIRKKYGEATKTNLAEPWEREYSEKKDEDTGEDLFSLTNEEKKSPFVRVKSHSKEGGMVHVRSHMRRKPQ